MVDTVVQAGTIHRLSVVAPTTDARHRLPSQLPPDVAYFVGRTKELAKLDDLLDTAEAGAIGSQAVVISAIVGSGGMGKTSLAVHWAHRVRERFPDGQLYVNLRGYDPRPSLTPSQALDWLLRALGVAGEAIPQDIDAMTASYRTLLAGRRILVVLDNAATPAQVRPLLPNTPTCLVMVTSRSRMSGLVARDGARRITLDELSSDEAVALVRDIVGQERSYAEPCAIHQLTRYCAGLPLQKLKG